jgi:hypothetical protein
MDDTENLNRKEFEYKLWQSGWMWEDMYQLTPYDEYEDESKAREDFLKWYRLNYEGSEEE